MNLYLLVLYGTYALGGFHTGLCGFVIVADEVYVLLRDSKLYRKHPPPSIRKVALQSTAVLMLSVVVTCSYYGLSRGAEQASSEAISMALFRVQTIVLNALLLGIVPFIFFPTIC